MRPRRETRRSVENVLAEEQREWLRQTLPPGPVRRSPGPGSGGASPGWHFLAGVALVGGIVAGEALRDRPSGAAVGVVLAAIIEAAAPR